MGWIGPVASASSPATTVVMTAPLSVTATYKYITTTTVQAASGKYGSTVTLKATVTSPGLGPTDGAVQFKVGGTNVGLPVPVTGNTANTTYVISYPAGPYNITAIFIPSTVYSDSSSGTNTLTVTKAPIVFSGSSSNLKTVPAGPGGTASFLSKFTVSKVGGNNPLSTTPATMAKPLASTTATADTTDADITNAQITMTLIPMIGTGNINCPVTYSAPVDGAITATATCSRVPVNAYDVQVRSAGDYFEGDPLNSVLAVTDPTLKAQFHGEGTVRVGGLSDRFSFEVQSKPEDFRNSPKGVINYRSPRASGEIRIDAASITSISATAGAVAIIGQGTVNGAGDYTIVVIAKGSKGKGGDTLGFRVLGLTPALSYNPVATASGTIVSQ